MKTLPFGGDLLLTLLLHVGAAASICAWLARSATFRKVLFTELRDSDQKLKLMLFVTPPLLFGVFLRIVGPPYRAADLMLEGSFLLGLLGGRLCDIQVPIPPCLRIVVGRQPAGDRSQLRAHFPRQVRFRHVVHSPAQMIVRLAIPEEKKGRP